MTIDETRSLVAMFMRELVPGEEYEIVVEESDGQFKLELVSESKRAIVAWAEISYALEQMIDKQFDQNIGF